MAGGTFLIPVYVVYGAVSVGLTWWLARTLFHHGEVFLTDVFEERPELATAINRLLVVGFYMLNLGYAFLILRANEAASALSAVELLISKLGILLVSLGVIHFVNMLLFWRIRRRQEETDRAPVAAQAYVNPGVAEEDEGWGQWSPQT